MEQSETYFTLAESRKATCFSDIKDNIGVVLYSAETARKEEEDAGAIFVKEDLPGGMVMVLEAIMYEPGDGYYHLPVDTEMVVNEVLDIGDMMKLGLECMAKKLPEKIERTTDIVNVSMLFENPNFYVIHTDEVFGASALFYPGVQERIAKKLGGSYFVLPLTRDFFILAADNGTKDPDRLQKILIDQNADLDPELRVSDDVLYYDAGEGKLTTVNDARNSSNVVYLNRTNDYMN